MKKLLLFLTCTCCVLGYSPLCAQKNEGAQLKPEQHEFIIHNFRTESSATLPEAKIVYGTYGHLNAAGDNAVLLPSHYMADMNGYAWRSDLAKPSTQRASFSLQLNCLATVARLLRATRLNPSTARAFP